jgi:hypothetical protein
VIAVGEALFCPIVNYHSICDFLKPPWLVAAIKGGKKLDDFLIDKSARKGRKKRRPKR